MAEQMNEDSTLIDIAKDLVAIEKPLPEKADMKAVVELLGRIEHELVIYRRERIIKSAIVFLGFAASIGGLSFLIPEFIRVYTGQ